MKQPYIVVHHHTVSAAGEKNLWDDRVHQGRILEVRNIAAYWDAQGAAEGIVFLVEDAGVEVRLGIAGIATVTPCQNWSGHVCIGENDRVGMWGEALAAGDVVHLYVCGVLWSYESWCGVQR
jgi:hypothetical protein